MKFLTTLCIASLATFAALAQSQPTMLSQSRYSVNSNGHLVLEDSLTHTHSHGRISYGLPEVELSYSPNDGVYKADQSNRVFKNLSGSSNNLVDRMTRVFNSGGLISEYHEQVKVGRSGVNYMETFKEWYHYNANMQLDTQWWNSGQVQGKYVHVYQNNKQLTGWQESFNQISKLWELVRVDSFTVNGTDSFFLQYANNFSGLQLQQKHKYQRDANLRVIVDSFFYQGYFSSVTQTSYNASGRKAEDSVFKAGYDHRITYRYDNNGNLISKTRYEAVNIIRDTMTYNPVNQLTSVKTHSLVNNVWLATPGSFWRYYYYGFPTGISDVVHNDGLRLYPVPATSYINLDITFDKPEKFTVRILNMQGQIVRHWDEAAQTSYTKRIQLDGMTAGNYIVQLMSESKAITRQFSVIN